MNSSPFSKELVQRLAQAEKVGILTGAGISAESGIATFRDPGGLWTRFKPEELSNVRAFLANPSLVQAWFQERKKVVVESQPNPGHKTLVDMEALYVDERGGMFVVITQNVDDLHRRAGSNNVVKLHGTIMRNYCISCAKDAAEEHMEASGEEDVIRCIHCDGLIRPDVVWFGEPLPYGVMQVAYAVAEDAQVFLSIGTSAIVQPAANIPLRAREHGAYVAEINLEPSVIAPFIDETVIGPSGTVLPALFDAVRSVN